MNKINILYKYLPKDNIINWDLINKEIFNPFYKKMENTMQEPKWHGEGNVLIHTKMVVGKLIELDEYKELNEFDRLIVFLACLFHDIGKITATRVLNGEIVSMGHARIGSVRLREYLWKELGLAGSMEYQIFREALCFYVRYHSIPIWDFDDKTQQNIIKISLNQKLTKYFSIKLLSIVSKADALGRISSDDDKHLSNINKFKAMAIELDCYDKPFEFEDAYTKYQYFIKNNIWPYQKLYNDSWGKIIVLCGLPGTGKDTFIKNNYPDMNVISLDDIRKRNNISPTENQDKVVQIARDMAKDYLRNKKEFIWNATNLSNLVRNKVVKLMHDYNAMVEIIFLETEYNENLLRNKNREKYVNENVINKLLENIDMPQCYEAYDVKWVIV